MKLHSIFREKMEYEDENTEDFESSGSEYVPETPKRKFFTKRRLFYEDESDENDALTNNTTKKICVSQNLPTSSKLSDTSDSLLRVTDNNHRYLLQSTPEKSDVPQSLLTCSTTQSISQRLVDYTDSEEIAESDSEKTPIKTASRTRKRKSNPEKWKKNIRKRKYQAGESYLSATGKLVPKKRIVAEKDCDEGCRFQCKEKFDEEGRNIIRDAYYSLQQNEKYYFLLKNGKRILVKRKKNVESQYRSFSFEYYLEKDNQSLRVCKKFFLNTLSISQKPVYNTHLKKNDAGTPQSNRRGKLTKEKISKEVKDCIRNHISSFPRVESHYCRADSKKEYLNPLLNINKMYDLYLEMCREKEISPAKLSMYRHIFNFEFNLDFLKPKSDRCDVCEEYRLLEKENRVNEVSENSYQRHILRKKEMREERETDRKSTTPTIAVVCFDLENVFNLPKSDVSVLFYKQKLTAYNLTAHCSLKNQVYCSVWPETLCGRSGNDIASAFIQILENIVTSNPSITEIITWSDSCVPQNRNSLISVAVSQFLQNHQHIKAITMKYSLPGHSCVQVVDNAHSRIEKHMRVSDVWSPLSLIRLLKKVDRKNPFSIILMQSKHFMDYQKTAKKFCYDKVPYTKVSQLRFTQGQLSQVEYKTDHSGSNFEKVDIRTNAMLKAKPKVLQLKNFEVAPVAKILNKSVSEAKLQHIQYSFKWMPKEDQVFMRAIPAPYLKNK